MSANDSFQNQNPLQNYTFKIIRGAVFRLLLIIVLPILMGIFIPKITTYLNFTLPGWVMPVVIILTIILGIAILVHFLITQYMLLKTGFQNLENSLAASVPQQGIEYTELPNMQQGYMQGGQYQQGYMNNAQYQQGYMNNAQYPQGYMNNAQNQQSYMMNNTMYSPQSSLPSASGYTNAYPTQQASVPAKKKSGCFGKLMAILISIVIFGIIELVTAGSVFFNYYYDNIYDTTTAVAHNVEKVEEYKGMDEDGNEQIDTKYYYDMTFNYKGKEYNVHKSRSYYTAEDQELVIFVNPDSPTETADKLDDSTVLTLTIIAIVVAAIWLAIVIGILKS